jgi:PHD/YefM family antitoxin component YafN of YafNO toxin-antitoxin module
MDVQMSKVQYLVNERGQKTAIVLPIKEYESMQEDLHDLAVMAERRDEPVISFDELKKRLEKDGLL